MITVQIVRERRAMNLICDKCGRPVSLENDAVFIEAVRDDNESLALDNIARHFLPDGNCPGSPSRAQHIEGQPRDPVYPYHPEKEALWRKAYAEAQVLSASL